MSLEARILAKLKRSHIGRDRAIKKEALLEYLFDNGYLERPKNKDEEKNTDRKVRLTIASNPEICSCENGYYLAKNYEDVEYAILYLRSVYAIPVLKKIRQKKEAYPQFYRGEQLEFPNAI